MHRRRNTGYLLILLALATGLMMLVGPAAPPTSAQWQPDLVINLYRDPDDTDPFAPGNEITYQIYFINWSAYPANDVRVTVTLPEHTTYVSSSGPGFVLVQPGPTQVVWYKQVLTVFERGWLSFTVRVNADAPVGAGVETEAEIYSFQSDSDSSTNDSSVKEIVWPAGPDLQVTKHLWPNSAPIAAGSEISYEITVWNQGGTVASSVRLTETLTTDCTYVSDDPADSGFTTAQTGQTVVWTKDTMAPAEYGAGPDRLFVHCQIAADWTREHWMANMVEISTPDAEYSYDNNLSRWVYKPEADRRYGAAITSLDDKTFRQISDAGFDYVLYYLDWSQTEPADNQHYWGNLDHAVWQAWRYNLRLVVRVDRAPGWARGPGTATAPPGNPAKLGEFLQAAAGRWPRQPGNPDEPQVYGYVIWNEPNLADEWGGNAPDAAAYVALLQAAYNGVKAGSANAWVISAGLAPTGDDPPNAVNDLDYLQLMYDVPGAKHYFDYLGANPMGFAYAPDDTSDPNGYNFARAEEWRAIMQANGDAAKGMFGAEAGWLRDTPIDLGSSYNWMKVSEIDQAHYLARAYHKARCEWTRSDGTPWIGPLITWNLDFASGAYSETNHSYWFGVTDENRSPLRAYTTLQNAATRGPADLWLDQELIDPVGFGKDFRYVIRYTNIGGQAASGVVLVDTLPEGVEYVADTGSGTPSGGQVAWNLGDVDTCTYETITLTLRLTGEEPLGGYLVNTVEAGVQANEPYSDDNTTTLQTPFPFGTGPGGVGDTTGRSNLTLWLKADTGVTSSADSVSAWFDQSGYGNDASQDSATHQPGYHANALNGQPVVQFDGSDDYLSVPDDASLDLTADQTLLVAAQTADTEAMYVAKYGASSPYTGWGLSTGVVGSDGDLQYWSSNGGSWFDSNLNLSDGNAHIAATRRSSGTVQAYRNGAGSSADSGHGNGSSGTQLVIGLNPNLSSQPLNGDMAEVIAFDKALNQAEHALVENYLSAKYNIAISNDLYHGDAPAAGDFDLDVAGIGQEASGSNTVARSAGMIVRDNSFLRDSGDYLTFGHRTASNATTTADLPDTGDWASAPSPVRWERHWYIQVTDAPGSVGGGVDIVFYLSEAGFSGQDPAIASNYRLLKRSDLTGQYSDIATAALILGDQVVFRDVSVASLGSNFSFATLDNTQSPLGPDPTAIELVSLTATATVSGTVRVEWETATEIDNLGFNIYRATEPDALRTQLNEALLSCQNPGSPMGAAYSWLDQAVVPGLSYHYWLEDIDANGVGVLHGPVSVSLPSDLLQHKAFLPILCR